MRVPKDLQYLVKRKELRYSLKTGYVSVAKEKARYLAGQVHLLFRILRKKETILRDLTIEEIQEMLKNYLDQKLKECHEVVGCFFSPADVGDDEERAVMETMRGSLKRELKHLIFSLNTLDFSRVGEHAEDLVRGVGIEDVDRMNDSFVKLCEGLMRAEIKVAKYQLETLNGEGFQDELEDVLNRTLAKNTPPQLVVSPARDEDPQDSETLKKVFEEFWKEYEPIWKERTKVEYRTIGKDLLEFLGPETRIRNVDYQKARDYKKVLMAKKGRSGKSLSRSRVNMYLGTASQFFNFAVKNNFAESNPFAGLQISTKKGKRPDQQRQVFDQEDLKKLFCESKEYSKDTHKHPYNFWLPILALYTGCRLEELCQLYVEDVREVNDVWCLDINEDKDDKSVKNSEKRMVPLHPLIVDDLNFVEYVRSLPDQKGRVFPELKRINNRYGHYAGRWFGRYKEKCGIAAPPGEKVFHSFRHTFANYLKQHDVPELYIKEIAGHSIFGETMGRYAKRYSPEKLYEEAILKLDYGIDLSHLKNSRYVIKNQPKKQSKS